MKSVMALAGFGLGAVALFLPAPFAATLQYMSIGLSLVALLLVYSSDWSKDPFRKRRSPDRKH